MEAGGGERWERMRERRGGEENVCREIKPDFQGSKGQEQRDEDVGRRQRR